MPLNLDDVNSANMLFLMYGSPHARQRQVLAHLRVPVGIAALWPAAEEQARTTVDLSPTRLNRPT